MATDRHLPLSRVESPAGTAMAGLVRDRPSPGPPSCRRVDGHAAERLRPLHHLDGPDTDVSPPLRPSGPVWTWELLIQSLRFLSIASSHDFVMSSVLAFSAAHLAWLTESSETNHLAYYHRGIALKGLQEAIGSFSRQTSDAVLAASILLSWQATEW